MGHYASEMADFDYKPPAYVKKHVDEKVMRVLGEHHHEGSMTEETTSVEWVAQYDSFDYDTLHKREEKGDPFGWKFRRIRTFISTFFGEKEEDIVKQGLYFIKMHGDQDMIGRPGRVMRRTVTYGPWEVIAESSEKQEGWY